MKNKEDKKWVVRVKGFLWSHFG